MKSVWKNAIVSLFVASVVLAGSRVAHCQEKKDVQLTEEMAKLNKGLKDAASKGDIPTMQEYLKKGANPNWNDPADYGKTVLIRTIINKKLAVAKVLLENGADIHLAAADGQKRFPLFFAAVISTPEIAEYILSEGGGKDINREPGLLGSLCRNGYVPAEMIGIMIKAGADPNLLYNNKSPLVNAIEKERPDYIKALIEAKANVNWKDTKGKSTLQFAIEKANVEIIALLKEAGAKE